MQQYPCVCVSMRVYVLQATKRIWAYIKEHNLPKRNVGGKPSVVLDDSLSTALKRKSISFTSLARCLAEHMKDSDDLVDEPKGKGKAVKRKRVK